MIRHHGWHPCRCKHLWVPYRTGRWAAAEKRVAVKQGNKREDENLPVLVECPALSREDAEGWHRGHAQDVLDKIAGSGRAAVESLNGELVRLGRQATRQQPDLIGHAKTPVCQIPVESK